MSSNADENTPKFMGRFRFSSQLYALFVMSVAITGAGLLFAMATLTAVRKDLNEISTSHLELISRSLELAEKSGTLSAMTSTLVDAKSVASHESAYRAVRDRTDKLQIDIVLLEGLSIDRTLWSRLNATIGEFAGLAEQIGKNSSQRTLIRADIDRHLQALDAMLQQSGVARLTQDDLRAVSLIELMFAAQTNNAYRRWARALQPVLDGLSQSSPVRMFAQGDVLGSRLEELRLNTVLDGEIAHFKRLADRMIFIANEIYFQSHNQALSMAQQTNDLMAWRMPLLIGTLMLSALVVVLTWVFISTRLVAPLNILYDEVQSHASGKPVDFAVHGPPEIERIAEMLETSAKEAQKREAEVRSALSKAELANQSKSQFLAAASHDLRQPLQAIKLFCEVLRNGLLNDTPSEKEKNVFYLDNIEQAIGGLGDLLNALLDISKLEANIVQKNVSALPIDDVLHHITKTYTTYAQERGVELSIVHCSQTVSSDPVLLKQIVENLVSNGIRYAEGRRVVVGCRRQKDQLRIDVCDNGIGIPLDEQERIFDDFYQLENPGRQRTKGLGLGLSIVRRTAEILGHPVSLTSALGKGSMFSVLVPIAGEHQTKPVLPKINVGGGSTVLEGLVWLAEDDASVLRAMTVLLESWGLRVVSMSSAHDTMMYALKTQKLPDLLLFDYQLDEHMNGLELYQTCISQWDKDVPCIIISGNTLPSDLDRISQSRADLLTKPVTAKDLFEKIKPILSQPNSHPDT